MLSIDEAERAAEQLLGPYTGEEHAKRGQVVREPRLNRAYADPSVRLVERPDPDAGKKKRVRGPDELETLGPIRVAPLRAIGADGAGGSSAGLEVAGPAAKKMAVAPEVPQGASSSSASSSAESLAIAPRGEVVASSFGIASFAPEEVSGGTPSEAYGRGSADTRVEERATAPRCTG